MKVNSYLMGVGTALFMIIIAGANKFETGVPIWEYAELRIRVNELTWEGPGFSVSEENAAITSDDLFNNSVGHPFNKKVAELNEAFARRMEMTISHGQLPTIAVVNRVGQDGWELVSESQNCYAHVLYFKRVKQ
jgi:hypothetical protein